MAIPNSSAFEAGTWIEAEEAAYPAGGQTRRAMAQWPDGKNRACKAGISDTFFTIPANSRKAGKYTAGYLTLKDGTLHFIPNRQEV